MIKIAFLVPDNRQEFGQWDLPAPVFGPAPQGLLDGFAQLSDCELHVLFCLKRPLPVPEKLAPNIYAHSLLVPPAGYLKTLYAGCLRAIRKEISRLKIDIVHGQGTERFPAYCAARSGLPNVITIHGNMRLLAKLNRARPFSFQWIAARLEGWTVPRTNGVVCISSYTKGLVEDTAKRTWVVPNAVNESFFDVTRAAVTPAQILCVANIEPRKNQIALIEALDPLARDFKFTLKFFGRIGDDDYSRRFTEMVKNRAWCEGPRSLRHSELPAELSRASLLVLPSIEDNCPMAVLEAMAAGLPVAAAAVGGVPDLIEPRATGWLFDPHDPRSIADTVRNILANPAAAENIGRAGQADASRRFHPKAVAARHLEIYREVIACR